MIGVADRNSQFLPLVALTIFGQFCIVIALTTGYGVYKSRDLSIFVGDNDDTTDYFTSLRMRKGKKLKQKTPAARTFSNTFMMTYSSSTTPPTFEQEISNIKYYTRNN